MENQLQLALNIAKQAHANQKDLAGKPYMTHIQEVVRGVSHLGQDAMTVAALHDVIEDSDITIDNLREYGFSQAIITAVQLLTRTKSVDEDSYYARIKNNALARAVKISDLTHNSDTRRIVKPNAKDDSRTKKYLTRLEYLKEETLRVSFQQFNQIIEKNKEHANFDALDDYDAIFSESVLLEREKSSLTAQPWDAVSTANKSKERIDAEIQSTYEKAAKYANDAKEEFVRLMKYVASEPDKILVDVKSFKSFLNKAVDRNRQTNQITDFLRGAILAPDDEEVAKIVNRLKKAAKIVKYEYKAPREGGSLGYYGSHHFDVEVGGIIAEIQVMTRKLWTYKAVAHDIYSELRSAREGDFTPEEIKQLAKQSRDTFFRGNNYRL